MKEPASISLPVLSMSGAGVPRDVVRAYEYALRNLVEINAIPAAPALYNKTGLLPEGARMIRAGGDYQTPWTRDASINSWNAASLLVPEIARNTLWAVCERLPSGRLIVNRDNQWWDKVIWITAAWNHVLVTGDEAFLARAYPTAVETMRAQIRERLDPEFQLFKGPAMMQDGIAGYPEPPFDPQVKETPDFVLSHPASHDIMALSTNALYFGAFRSMGAMAAALGGKAKEARVWRRHAAELKRAINRHFWCPERQTYAYFLHGAGDLRGVRAMFQEALGLSLILLLDLADRERRKWVLNHVRTTARGIPLVDPEFSRNQGGRIGRHSRILWPMAQGYWAHAAAREGEVVPFRKEVESLASLVRMSGWDFREIYNPVTGRPDGGWQAGKHWESCRHQTWSATAYLRMILQGLFGLEATTSGLVANPLLPAGWGPVALEGLHYRAATLDVRLSGQGRSPARITLDGRALAQARVAPDLSGHHVLEVRLA